jgi:hypothetical protein
MTDWLDIEARLNDRGWAMLPSLLSIPECELLIAAFDDDTLFRKHVDMTAQGYGRGEYKYFRYPLPPRVEELRGVLYERLAPIANGWSARLGTDAAYPPTHREFVARCHAEGQTKPTPLVLRYGPGDYNNLHQDVYGAHVFPLQVAVLLSEPHAAFTGGEFVLTEESEDAQTRASVVPLGRGDGVVFAVRERPRGTGRTIMRHGVSEIRSGSRHTLGIIFHDAK